MLTQTLVFYLFAALAVFSAVMVVLQNSPVRSALFLVLTFLTSAGIWLLAYAEFLALILVLVYVGAVMTLFLFVIMMLNIDVVSMKRHFVRYIGLGTVIVGLLVFLMVMAVRPKNFRFERLQQAIDFDEQYSNTERLGMLLYTDYVYAFEIAAVLLLVAIISAVALAHRGFRQRKNQNIPKQLLVEAKDRISLIKMKAEKS